MKEQDDKIKQSTLHVIGNSWWILKYVFKYAPTLVWDKVIRIPIIVAGAYIDINLTRWILDSVEQGTLSATIKTIIAIFSFIILTKCVTAILSILVVPQKRINLRANMRKELIEKVSRIDQLNFQKSRFFDNYTLALNEVDTRAIQVLESVAAMAAAYISFDVITDTTAGISRRFSLFGVIAVCIDMLLGLLRQNMNYKQTVETTADDRKRAYVGRVTYQPEFTSDLKIYPEFKKLLIFRYEQATISVKRIIHKYAKKIIWIDQGQQIPGMIFRKILPWTLIALSLFRQEVTIPEATVLAAAAITIPDTLSKFMSHLMKLYTHSLYIEKLRQLFSFEEGIEREDKSDMELQRPVDMALNNVSFAYADDMPTVLKQVSLNIRHGEKSLLSDITGQGRLPWLS